MTVIIGIDPGSRLTGYGIIRKTGSKLEFIDAGTIRTETEEMPLRLKRIYEGLKRVIDFYQPTEASVEQVFLARNPDSALKLGQARGAAVTALMMHDVAVWEYSARQIKQAVVGVGSAEKEQVQAMVTRLLNIPVIPQADAADALAAALCHAYTNQALLRIGATAIRSGRSRR
ncbi:MAG TPA: crossover junction endodeoxyribonuclease RuvC [Fluviicoccus sp.]|nr:crossover junction endodeoxyribonuclease RuvC [Fluviicoccus sp.]